MADRAWLPPDTAMRNYQRMLLSFVKEMERDTLNYLQQLDLLRADDWSDSVTQAILYLLESALRIGQRVTARLPEVYAQVNQFNDRQWRAVVKAGTGLEIGPAASMPPGATMTNVSGLGQITARFGVGVDVYRSEPWLAQAQNNWVAQNSSLIKTVPQQYMARVESVIREGVLAGESPRSLAEKIRVAGGVTESRAKLIAVDQISKANAELTKHRQEDLGIKEYTWITSRDERVRELHKERNGKMFSWDKPPSDGHPGMPIRCRCHAKPSFPPLD